MLRTVASSSAHGARHLHREQLVAPVPQLLVARPDPEDRRHPVALDQRLEEVHERRVGALDSRPRPSFFSSVEKYGEKKKTCQLAVLAQRVGELAELLADRVEQLALGGDLEQRPRVDLGDLFH